MSELTEKKLLTLLGAMHHDCIQDNWDNETEQEYNQIVQIIKLHFSDDWQQVKKDLGKFMQGKKVTEEYVKRWADFWNDNFHSTLSSHVEPHVRQMLEEAGVEVVEK